MTSYTDINHFLPYRVPEVWILKGNRLLIYRLLLESYVITESSYFPNVREIVQQCLQMSNEQTTSEVIRWLKNFLHGQH